MSAMNPGQVEKIQQGCPPNHHLIKTMLCWRVGSRVRREVQGEERLRGDSGIRPSSTKAPGKEGVNEWGVSKLWMSADRGDCKVGC